MHTEPRIAGNEAKVWYQISQKRVHVNLTYYEISDKNMDAIVKITVRSLPSVIKASSQQKGNGNKVDPDTLFFLRRHNEFQKPELI